MPPPAPTLGVIPNAFAGPKRLVLEQVSTMADPVVTHQRWNIERAVTVLWGLAIAAAVVNQAAGAVKATVPEPATQQEKTVQEAARRLRTSPPPDSRSLVLLGPPEVITPDSLYFGYRLQYLIYPQRVDRFFFPWEGMTAETYKEVYLCDDLMLLRPADVESHSGTVYRLRTPISTSRLRGGAQ